MAPPVRAEVALTSLQNCLVNLPPGLIALISNTNIVCLLHLQPNPVLTFDSRLKMWSSNFNIDHKRFRPAQSRVGMPPAFKDRHMLAGLECPAGQDQLLF